MTQYVMVPVPEEHVTMVENFIRWGGTEPARSTWTTEAMQRLLEAVDETTHQLLVRVAGKLTSGEITRMHEAAEWLDCSKHEIVGITVALNESMKQIVEGQNYIVIAHPGPSASAGTVELRDWIIAMTPEVAQLIETITANGAVGTS